MNSDIRNSRNLIESNRCVLVLLARLEVRSMVLREVREELRAVGVAWEEGLGFRI